MFAFFQANFKASEKETLLVLQMFQADLKSSDFIILVFVLSCSKYNTLFQYKPNYLIKILFFLVFVFIRNKVLYLQSIVNNKKQIMRTYLKQTK